MTSTYIICIIACALAALVVVSTGNVILGVVKKIESEVTKG